MCAPERVLMRVAKVKGAARSSARDITYDPLLYASRQAAWKALPNDAEQQASPRHRALACKLRRTAETFASLVKPHGFASLFSFALAGTIIPLPSTERHILEVQAIDRPSEDPQPFQPIGRTPGWKLVFSDEFNGNALDSAKWIPSMEDGLKFFGHDVSAYEPENVLFRNGKVVLRGLHKPGDGKPYTSGAITTVNRFQFGYFESRVKLPASIGTWPAWWFGWPKNGAPWKEYDIFEARGGDSFLMQSAGGKCAGFMYRGVNPSDGFHIYGFLWTPKEVAFYVDGKETCRTENLTFAPMPLMFDNLVGGGAACPPNWSPCPDDRTFPADMEIDYMRVWHKDGLGIIEGQTK